MSTKICLGCGRTFESSGKKQLFCSRYCKKRYSNHKFFNCSDCRTTKCPVRNNESKIAPEGCLNLKWSP